MLLPVKNSMPGYKCRIESRFAAHMVDAFLARLRLRMVPSALISGSVKAGTLTKIKSLNLSPGMIAARSAWYFSRAADMVTRTQLVSTESVHDDSDLFPCACG
jgi:hypothetical protein